VQVRLSERGAVRLRTQAVMERLISMGRFSVFYLKWHAEFGSRRLCRLAETEGDLCRSLDSALCMVSVLQPSPMAGEMFPWRIQCSIS